PFYISGEVHKPGQYPCPPGMSLAKAIAVAGGYTFRADSKRATISRVSTKGLATPDTAILPGDVVVVPEAWF
ncbi:MAG: polysaccharide export protein, partial [Sphingomonadales bacterium]